MERNSGSARGTTQNLKSKPNSVANALALRTKHILLILEQRHHTWCLFPAKRKRLLMIHGHFIAFSFRGSWAGDSPAHRFPRSTCRIFLWGWIQNETKIGNKPCTESPLSVLNSWGFWAFGSKAQSFSRGCLETYRQCAKSVQLNHLP